MRKSKRDNSPDRRDFLKTVVAGAAGAGLAASAAALPATPPPMSSPEAPTPSLPLFPPDLEADPVPEAEVLNLDRSGSDFMVDVIKSIGVEYVRSVAGSSFRAVHESVINYGGNKNPEFITCLHEEASVAMSHGYAKIERKPLCVFAHGTVGLQHAAMAIYNAYCDRVPVYIIIGNNLDATKRDSAYGEWPHSVQDAAAMVRDYTKWDDTPISLQHFAESAVRAYKIAMTPPMLPVVLVADSELQERPVERDAALHIPKLTLDGLPQADTGSVKEAARMLIQAENPVIVVDRAVRNQACLEQMIALGWIGGSATPLVAQRASTAPSQTSANVENGNHLFVKYGCYECHGREGQGAYALAPRVAPDPIPLESLKAYVRKPTGEMPPYTAKIVSDQELADIYAFLQSRPHPPSPSTIPGLH